MSTYLDGSYCRELCTSGGETWGILDVFVSRTIKLLPGGIRRAEKITLVAYKNQGIALQSPIANGDVAAEGLQNRLVCDWFLRCGDYLYAGVGDTFLEWLQMHR